MTPSPVQPSPREERAQVPPAKQAPSNVRQRPPEFQVDRLLLQVLPLECRAALPAKERTAPVARQLLEFRFDRLPVQPWRPEHRLAFLAKESSPMLARQLLESRLDRQQAPPARHPKEYALRPLRQRPSDLWRQPPEFRFDPRLLRNHRFASPEA